MSSFLSHVSALPIPSATWLAGEDLEFASMQLQWTLVLGLRRSRRRHWRGALAHRHRRGARLAVAVGFAWSQGRAPTLPRAHLVRRQPRRRGGRVRPCRCSRARAQLGRGSWGPCLNFFGFTPQPRLLRQCGLQVTWIAGFWQREEPEEAKIEKKEERR